MKKLLVPIDFSDVSKTAVEFAIDLAKGGKGEVILVHSLQYDDYHDELYSTDLSLKSLRREVRIEVNSKMEAFVKSLDANVKIESRVMALPLLKAVKYVVDYEGIDSVIMGTHGSSGISELFTGSNTEKVVRGIGCPVVAVPSGTSLNSIRKILVPVDLTAIQDEFMAQVLDLQKRFSAEIEFLWIRTPHNIENNKLVTRDFSNLVEEYGFRNPTFTICNNIFPFDGILEQAKQSASDMVVMATHGRKGISHMWAGSVTEDIINHARVPVWAFHLNNDDNIKVTGFQQFADQQNKVETLEVH